MFRYVIAGILAGNAALAADVTFNRDVLPILQKNCQSCHRPGEIGPSSFLTYDSTRPWAKAIKTAVVTRNMPPWFADPKYGHFANDRRLSDADVSTLSAWADAGAPEGDPKDRPAPVQWHEGWNIQPDVVFEMPKPYTVPATGTIEYTYFVVPSGFTKDTWVIDGEVRPSNRVGGTPRQRSRAASGIAVDEGRQAGRALRSSAQRARARRRLPGNQSNEWLLGYVPGVHGEYFDKDHRAAKLIPAGSDIVFEMHYTANGKSAGIDQTKVGFVLAKGAPEKRLLTVPVADMSFTIPPGDPNHAGHAEAEFDQPVELVYSQPHMHLRGKDMDIHLEYPTGESQMLVSVPHFDFNWQLVYYEDKPRHAAQGHEDQARRALG